ARARGAGRASAPERPRRRHPLRGGPSADGRRAHPGALRLDGRAASRRGTSRARLRAAGAEPAPRPGDRRPRELLAYDVRRGTSAAARPLPEAPVAGGPARCHAAAGEVGTTEPLTAVEPA